MPGPRRAQKPGFYGYLKRIEDWIEHLFQPLSRWGRAIRGKQPELLRAIRKQTGRSAGPGTGRSLQNFRQSFRFRPGQAPDLLRRQPKTVLASYVCGLLGVLASVHDYHHFQAEHFGISTPLLGAAIVLYLVGSQRRRKR